MKYENLDERHWVSQVDCRIKDEHIELLNREISEYEI